MGRKGEIAIFVGIILVILFISGLQQRNASLHEKERKAESNKKLPPRVVYKRVVVRHSYPVIPLQDMKISIAASSPSGSVMSHERMRAADIILESTKKQMFLDAKKTPYLTLIFEGSEKTLKKLIGCQVYVDDVTNPRRVIHLAQGKICTWYSMTLVTVESKVTQYDLRKGEKLKLRVFVNTEKLDTDDHFSLKVLRLRNFSNNMKF